MPIRRVINGVTPVKIWTNDVEGTAMEQLALLSKLPFIHHHVAVMPDTHWGNGTTIGCVIPTKDVIIPAAVGVDIGCGMMAVQTSLKATDLPESLKPLRSEIERTVPHGRTQGGRSGDRGAWSNPPASVIQAWNNRLADRFNALCEKHPVIKKSNNLKHLGSLGTGNHFIEICLDQNDSVWVMLHSGSRGVGAKIGMHFIGLAKKDMERHFINLPDKNLAYLREGTQHFDDYVEAVEWAQDFAMSNRTLMMDRILKVMKDILPPFQSRISAVNCHHNYIVQEHHYGEVVWVTRKGAIRAGEGELGIIPGSMGASSYIVEGLGNKESFLSCSHGAGRRMSRKAAREKFTIDDLAIQTANIECRKDADVIDEIPGAYKNIDEVMENQTDLVKVRFTLHQVLNVKG